MSPLQRKDLLGIGDLREGELESLVAAVDAAVAAGGPDVQEKPLRGKVVVNLFYEPSTRTRTSFEIAAKGLGADVVNITTAASSVVKGESLKDTARTLEALGAAVIVIRHPLSGAPHFVARHVRAAVVNAGDGAHEHPTQALLDLVTMRRLRGDVAGKEVLIVGDILHSRVARSNALALTRLGARVTLVGPPTLLPPRDLAPGTRMSTRLDEELPRADIVYMLRIQRERQDGGAIPSLHEYRRLFGLTRDRLRLLKDDALIMHPGPANVGVEVDGETVRDPRYAALDQVRTGVVVRATVLHLLAGGNGR